MKDLQAERSGDLVQLRWTTPSRTTDDMDVKGAMTAEICREIGARPATPVERATACAPVRRVPITPGPSEVDDALPPALTTEPVALLTYRVRIFNAAGRSAGPSMGAYALAGKVPPPVQSLRATASERGAILQWRALPTADPAESIGSADFVELWRSDLTARAPERRPRQNPSPVPGKGKPSRTQTSPDESPDAVHLRTSEAGAAPPGTIDATAAMGETYAYMAQRVRRVTVEGHALELRSAVSPAVTLAMLDTFPPKTPAGLDAISGYTPPQADPANTGRAASAPRAPYIDLSWEPNSESDLAGYRVYRQLARPDGSPQGPLARLTALPLAAPAYRDLAVKPGQGYIYSVTAVDAAGNESAPSAKALEVVPEIASPQNGQSPH